MTQDIDIELHNVIYHFQITVCVLKPYLDYFDDSFMRIMKASVRWSQDS